MQLVLTVKKGIKAGETIPIKKLPAVFGRDNTCDYVFQDLGVSRNHFQIEEIDEQFFIRDLGSTNGTALNGNKVVNSVLLSQDDIIIVGKTLVLEAVFSNEEKKKEITSFKIKKIAKTKEESEASDANFKNLPHYARKTYKITKPLEEELNSPIRKIPQYALKTSKISWAFDEETEELPDSKIIVSKDALKLPAEMEPAIGLSGFLDDNTDYSILDPITSKNVTAPAGPSTDRFLKRHINLEKTSILMPKDQLYHSYRALKTIYEVLDNCNNEEDGELLLQSLLQSVTRTIEADRGAVVLNWKRDGKYELKSSIGGVKSGSDMNISRTILEEVIEQGVSVISESPKDDERYASSESLRIQKVQSMICAPLISRKKIFGAIYLDRTGVMSAPFKNEDLELLAAIGKQTGGALEKSLLLEEVTRTNSYLASVIESVPLGIHTLNLDKNFTSWGKYSEDTFGYQSEEVVEKKNISMLLSDKRVLDAVFQELEDNGVFHSEMEMESAEGRKFPCRFGLSQIKGKDGKLIGYTGYHQDITEEKTIRDQMFAQDKMAALGVLAAGVAHDFNNVLSLIQGYTLLAKEDTKYLDKITTYTQRAGDIAGNLLKYSRQEAIKFNESNALTLLQEVLALVEKELHASNIQVETNFVELPNQFLIPGQIQEIFLNIILNARDAMGESGNLYIETKLIENKSHIIFKDTGEGIPAENLKRIFEPFFTTKAQTKKSGTGLGLAMTYQIAKKHDGEILVSSVVGEGTTFDVVLPVKSS